MKPFFGPSRDETLRRLRSEEVQLPITLGDGAPSYRIDRRDGEWMISPLVIDSDAAAGLEQAAIDNSGLYTWDFMAEAEPLFASRSKSQFLRWLEMWPWLGTSERRAVPPTARPEAVELDFEHLALDHRTLFRWHKLAERPAVETIEVAIVRDGATAHETIEPPAHLWDELLDVLLTNFPPPIMLPDSPDETTAPQIKVPDEIRRQKPGRRNIAPTAPLEVRSVQFLRARVKITDGGRRREVELEGETARDLLNLVFDFARNFGVPLPR